MAALLNVEDKIEPEGNAGGDEQQQEEQRQEEDGGAPERPEFIPEEAWTDKGFDRDKFLEIVRAEKRPESADAYALPEAIEGIDMEEAKASPLLAGLRTAAHEAGLDQDAFARVSTTMLTEAKKMADANIAAEKNKLGDKADARISAVNAWLGTALPVGQAKALAGMATTADAVAALETLMKSGARRTGSEAGQPGTGTTRKTRQQIEELMSTPAYNGKPNQRDPKVIAEVDAWFAEEAKLNPKDRKPK